MKILITGAAGFIGSTLVKKIMDGYHWDIWALDNNFRYSFEFLKKNKNKRLHIVQQNICNLKAIQRILKQNFDFVVHLAAIPGERLCKRYQEETIRTNIDGTRVLLEELSRYKLKGFLFASSQVVYGEPKKLPLKEFHPFQPYDLYSFSKAAGEMLINIYRNKGLPVVIFRFTSVYGHGVFARWNEILGRFVKLVHEEDYLTIYKPYNLAKAGEQAVDLIHVEDIASGIIRAIENINKSANQIYNLSYGSAISVLEVAEVVRDTAKKRLGRDIKFKFVETREDEISKLDVSNEKIEKELGWKPVITIEEGINDLFDKYAWYKEKYGRTKEPSLIETPTREAL